MEWASSPILFNNKTIPTRSFSILDKPKLVQLPISQKKTYVVETRPKLTPARNVEVPIHICPTKELLEPELSKHPNTTAAPSSSTANPIKHYSLDPDKIPQTTPSDKALVITGSKKAKRVRQSTTVVPGQGESQIDLTKLIKVSDSSGGAGKKRQRKQK